MKQYTCKALIIANAILVVAASITGCSKKSASQIVAQNINRNIQLNEVMSTESGMNDTFEPSQSTDTANTQTVPSERKLIRTGSINYQVNSLSETRAAVENWVTKYEGYISDSSESGDSINITAQIPSKHFDEAMSTSAQIGKITSKSVNSTDVSDQYYDLDSRLATKRILLDRLTSYLKQAKDVKDMLDIESKINDVTGDIESMQGQLNRLSKQIDYSTINISAQLPYNETEQGFIMPDTKSSFRKFCSNVLEFLSGFLFAILYIIIYGIPIVLFLFLLYWLCFGKIGLLRKLFAKVRAPGRRPNRTKRQQQ
jgi:hypothetical protein